MKFKVVAALLFLSQICLAREIHVHTGQSIQAAVDQAKPGDRVVVDAGTYHEAGRPCPSDPTEMCAVVITSNNITLEGQYDRDHAVVIENQGGLDAGIEAANPKSATTECVNNPAARISGVEITGFTANGFKHSGIRLICVDSWELAFNAANNNAFYGIFPSKVGRGRAHHNIVTGSNDTGLYVGQSHDARADHNLAKGNVSGFEIENSTNVRMDHNEATGNTGGILVFILPGLSIETGANNRVDHNWLHDNNKDNTCLNPGDDVCLVPPGSGVLVVAGDGNTIAHNVIERNQTFGIAISDFCTPFQVPTAQCFQLGFDPLPENTRVIGNVTENNGANSQFPGIPGSDLFWTGAGTGNCWSGNRASIEIPSPLPACSKGDKD